MKLEIELLEYKKLLVIKEKFFTLCNALYLNMQYDKYKVNGEQVRLDDNSILSVMKAIEPELYTEYVERIVEENEIKEN